MAALDPALDSARFRDCIHCGLCLESCPTYLETAAEAESPRGRIVIMKALVQHRIEPGPAALGHLDACLDCRACETACPSGVRYGTLIESVRAAMPARSRARSGLAARLRDHVLFRVLPDRARLSRWLALYRFAESTGLIDALRSLGLERRLGLPPLPRLPESSGLPDLRPHYPACGPRRGNAALFAGCVGEALEPSTNRASIRALTRLGLDVVCPARQTCCGAIHHHAGDRTQATQLARRNIEAFGDGDHPVIVSVAGCGAMLKEYPHVLASDPQYAERARRFSSRVRDVSEFLADPSHLARLIARPQPRSSSPAQRNGTADLSTARITYHDPCHLCHAQGIRKPPRELLRALGTALIPLAESEVCCGAAGTYALLQPEMSARLARRKWEHIRRTGAEIVATGNIGCIVQLRQYAPEDLRHVRVCHPVDLFDERTSR